MNLKLEFNEVIIENMTLRTEFLLHRLLKQDVKILLLTDYYNEKLDFRKELKITKYVNNSDYKKNKIVDLYCRYANGKYNLKVGTGKITKEPIKNEIIIKPITIFVDNKDTDNIKDMFKELTSVIKDDKYLKDNYNDKLLEYNNRYTKYKNNVENKKDKYINGLFKYYYESIIQLFKDNNNYYSISKITAMSSYIIAKNFFENKGNNVSFPNVFIKDFNIEFDMLLLKDKVNNNKYMYELDEVESIVELKSNGIIGYGKDDKLKNPLYNNKRWFESYITFDNNYTEINKKLKQNDDDINDNEIVSKKYNALKKEICKKDFFYFCLYEKNRKNTATYENTYFDIILTGKNYKGIYFGITDERDGYIIPIDYDINKF